MINVDRVVRVIVSDSGNAILDITDLYIKFKVVKSNKKASDSCDISIYNLSSDSRGKLEKDGLDIIVKAGYRGNDQVVFIGQLDSIRSEHQGPNVVTILECKDSESKVLESKKYKARKGQTKRELLEMIVKDIGLDLGPIASFKDSKYSRSVVYEGPASDILDSILDSQKHDWTVTDNEFQSFKATEASKEKAVLINYQTGLKNSPIFDGKSIKFHTQMNPEIRLNKLAKVESQSISIQTPPYRKIEKSGVFKVVNYVHEGDNRVGPFDSKAEGVLTSEFA